MRPLNWPIRSGRISKKLDHLLREWGEWHIRHIDFADEWGENILYGAQLLQGRVQDPGQGHKILCPDQPRHLQTIDINVNKLPFAQKRAVTCWYCAPNKKDGTKYTKPQVAFILYKSKACNRLFEISLEDGYKKLDVMLQDT